MIIHDVIQGSEAWHKLRLGRFTATDFTTVANGKKATIDTLIYKKVAERITGLPASERYINANMERGLDLESEARTAFEFRTGIEVDVVGFCSLDDWVGCSPDGLIGENKGIEIKCKDNHTHLECLLHGDNSYRWQIQGNLYVTGRDSWYFISYNPNFPIEKQLYITEYGRDDDALSKIEQGLKYAVNKAKEIWREYEG